MKLGKWDIRLMYEKWPSWAVGFWLYLTWFGCQLLMFKLVIMRYHEWNIDEITPLKAIELPDKKEDVDGEVLC